MAINEYRVGEYMIFFEDDGDYAGKAMRVEYNGIIYELALDGIKERYVDDGYVMLINDWGVDNTKCTDPDVVRKVRAFLEWGYKDPYFGWVNIGATERDFKKSWRKYEASKKR